MECIIVHEGAQCKPPTKNLLIQLTQEIGHVERFCVHIELAVILYGPLLLGSICIQLDADVVWILQVDGLGHTVIGVSSNRILGI